MANGNGTLVKIVEVLLVPLIVGAIAVIGGYFTTGVKLDSLEKAFAKTDAKLEWVYDSVKQHLAAEEEHARMLRQMDEERVRLLKEHDMREGKRLREQKEILGAIRGDQQRRQALEERK